MAARFGTHLWCRGFLKARIGLTTVAEIALEQHKTEKISSILRKGKKKAGRFLKERITRQRSWNYLPSFEQAAA
jgi:hypothetical protein